MKAMDVLEYYRTRFQVEFCFRDAKQFTGLTDCQSRDLDKLHFHFNAALTSVNIAKANALEKGTAFSMTSVKVLCHNIFLMQGLFPFQGLNLTRKLIESYGKRGLDLRRLLRNC